MVILRLSVSWLAWQLLSFRREDYNVLAFGQHLDDLAESFLMSVFHNGLLRTMKAHYRVNEGDLRLIRPFVFVREKDTRDFAEKNNLPIIPENCPACFEVTKEKSLKITLDDYLHGRRAAFCLGTSNRHLQSDKMSSTNLKAYFCTFPNCIKQQED